MVRMLFIIGAIAAEAIIACPTTAAQESQVKSQYYDIPAMTLKAALVEFAEQAAVSISFENLDVTPYRSGYVIGETTKAGALKTILSRTPFDFEFTGADTVKLVARDKIDFLRTPSGTAGVSTPRDAIFVTATKRAAFAQQLPVSISAVDGHTIARWGARDFNALAPRLAGVSFTNLGPSRNKIFLRGISDGSFADRTQSTVGVYLDETRIIFNDTNPDIRLIDLDRVEIVRGPQGSLYGAGSVGGIFRMITTKPDLDSYAARLRVSGSATSNGGANGGFDGAVNLPLRPGRAGIRIAGYYEHASGYVDDIGLAREDVNNSDIFGGRISARAQLNQHWTLDGAAHLQVVDLADTQYIFPELGGRRRSTTRNEPHRDKFQLFNVTLKGAAARANVTSSTAFINRDVDSLFDATPSLPSLTNISTAQGFFKATNKIQTFSHESRIVSDNDNRFSWLFGGTYTDRRETLNTLLVVDSSAPTVTPFFSNRRDNLSEIGAYGELAYLITDKLKITGGLRWSRTKFGVDVASGGTANPGQSMLTSERQRGAFSPKAAVSYQHSDDLLIYAQASQGSRIGGINVTTPLESITDFNPEDSITEFESDTLWNTEFGVKYSWLNGDLTVNAAAFYLFWNEIQTDQILPTGFTFITNAGKARNYGFEAEFSARPVQILDVTGAIFWNSPELVEANPFLGAQAGDTLPNIAAMSLSLGAALTVPLSSRWRAVVSADYAYVGESFLTFAEEAAPSMGDYHVGNIRATALKDNFRIGVYAENIWNEQGNTFAFGNAFSLATQAQATPLRPRTIGMFVETSF